MAALEYKVKDLIDVDEGEHFPMSTFFLEHNQKRIAISTSAKVACVSLRMWLYEVVHGLPWTGECIFTEFQPLTVDYEGLPESVEVVIAVHRDGVSRLRAVYDHRIRKEREAPELGISHFAANLPEYCARFRAITHHTAPQHQWLGTDPELYTHIVPLKELELVRGIVESVIDKETPPLPRVHVTGDPSPVNPKTQALFEAWTAYDSILGWDGQTRRVFENDEAQFES